MQVLFDLIIDFKSGRKEAIRDALVEQMKQFYPKYGFTAKPKKISTFLYPVLLEQTAILAKETRKEVIYTTYSNAKKQGRRKCMFFGRWNVFRNLWQGRMYNFLNYFIRTQYHN